MATNFLVLTKQFNIMRLLTGFSFNNFGAITKKIMNEEELPINNENNSVSSFPS